MKKFLFLLILCGLFTYKAPAKKITTSYRNALVFAYSQTNSVFEDDSIKLEIYDQCLWATNKTKKTIFIDLSQCFVVHNGSSFPMFDQKQNEKHASKKESLHLLMNLSQLLQLQAQSKMQRLFATCPLPFMENIPQQQTLAKSSQSMTSAYLP